MTCRGCGVLLHEENAFCDLGPMPLANALLPLDASYYAETFYPMRPLVCRDCLLVQLPYPPPPEQVFTDDYPFFAGTSISWLRHCYAFARAAARRLELRPTSRVLEIGSNDGSMLRPFRSLGIPALGVEPCASVAQHATMEGLPTVIDWWGTECATKLRKTLGKSLGKSWLADLVIATNVLAHVPDLHDFLKGVHDILAPGGTAVFEFAYVGDLIKQCQFDQVYAEHCSYFSLHSLSIALASEGLAIEDVEHLPTHGGSLRVWARKDSKVTQESVGVASFLEQEREAGLLNLETYMAFAKRPPVIKRMAWSQIVDPWLGHSVLGYGASAKATIALNYFGFGPGEVPFMVDTTSAKWDKKIPGVRIPICSPQTLKELQPKTVLNFCWNWQKESEANIRRDCPDAEILYPSAPWVGSKIKVAA